MNTPELPKIGATSWRICTHPPIGELSNASAGKQDIVDHGFYRAPDGNWRLWAALRGTKIGHLIYGWKGSSIEERDWEPEKIRLRAEAKHGERVNGDDELVCAPFFVEHEGKTYCFYNSEGVHWLRSDDGYEFERVLNKDGKSLSHAGGRDPMLVEIGGQWFAYSCVSTISKDNWPSSYIIVRTTRDFREWSDFTIVSQGGLAGNGSVSAESPFVVQRGDWFYLFRSSSINFNTFVYRSRTPYDFGVNHDRNLVAILPLKAPEIVSEGGNEYISDLADFDGIQMRRLEWVRDEEPEGSRYLELQRTHTKNELPPRAK